MPKKPQTRSTRGRFESVLTSELCDRLCETHKVGDFRNVTAVRCDVHPTLLTRWLREGAENPDAGLKTELYMRMAKTEGDNRATDLAEIRNPISMTETVEMADGKPVGKTTVARRTQGLQWYFERRYRQYRADALPKQDDVDLFTLLEPRAEAMSREAVLALIEQIAAEPWRLPPQVRSLFAAVDWTAAQPRELAHGQETTEH